MRNLMWLGLLGILFVGCGGDGSSSSDSDTTPSADVVSGADAEADTAEEPVVNEATAAALQMVLDEHAAFSADPGLTASVRTPDGAWWTGSAGVADLSTGTAMDANQRFRAGSNTKPIVAAAVMQLIEEGDIDLDAPLTDYLPQYEEWADVTVRMCLNMRSGIPEFLANTTFMLGVLTEDDGAVEPESVVEAARALEPLFAPGTGGAYTNTTYVLLGLIIEAVTGNDAIDEITDRVLTPLGMEDSYFDRGDVEDGMLARGYIDFVVAGPVLGVSRQSLSLLMPNAEVVDGLIDGTYMLHPSITWTSGALVTTSRDAAVFSHALMTGEIVGDAMLAEMMTTDLAQLFKGPTPYGLGVQYYEDRHGEKWGHGGLNFGYQAATFYHPDVEVTVAHMHNYLIDLYDGMHEELVSAALGETDTTVALCPRPTDLFRENDGGDYLNFGFRGEVNPPGVTVPTSADEMPIPGSAWLRRTTMGEPESLPGIFANAERDAEDGDIRISAAGMAIFATEDVIVPYVYINPGAFDRADADGRVTVGAANLSDGVVLIANATLVPGTLILERMCYIGSTDGARTGELHLCDAAAGAPEDGDMFRVYGALPITYDPDTVAATLELFGLPACVCASESGELLPCE